MHGLNSANGLIADIQERLFEQIWLDSDLSGFRNLPGLFYFLPLNNYG